jgi:hypothetical protein
VIGLFTPTNAENEVQSPDMTYVVGQNVPPPAIDCARVLTYAAIDDGVQFSGRTLLFIAGKELGQVPSLAICEDVTTADVLMFHCTREWQPLGCSAHTSLEEAKSHAERIYSGVSSRWEDAEVSPEAARAYLDELFAGQKCERCGRRPYEVNSLRENGSALLCDRCAE